MAIANIIQAIPSMALLGFMIPLLGIGTKSSDCNGYLVFVITNYKKYRSWIG